MPRNWDWAAADPCCAALAASSKGRDDPPPDVAMKTKFRQQALGWLKADLAAWTNLQATAGGPQREVIARTLAHWPPAFATLTPWQNSRTTSANR